MSMNKRGLKIYWCLLHDELEREQTEFPPDNTKELKADIKRISTHYNECRTELSDKPTTTELIKKSKEYAELSDDELRPFAIIEDVAKETILDDMLDAVTADENLFVGVTKVEIDDMTIEDLRATERDIKKRAEVSEISEQIDREIKEHEQRMAKVERNISKYKNIKTAATKLWEGLSAYGWNPILMEPKRSEECGYGHNWSIVMEEGPYEALVSLSLGGSLYAREDGYHNADGEYREPEFNVQGADGWYLECANHYTICFAKD